MSGSNALQITDPNASDNPLASAPSWADAAQSLGGTVSAGVDKLSQWLAAQRAKSSQMGLWNDVTGLPTAAGIVNAAQQYGNALMMGTTAPGASKLDNPAFAKWFGNSHVADENGQPLTVYKGMYPYDWTQETAASRGPEIESINRSTDFPAFNKGEPGVKVAGFFSDSPQVASHFATAGSTQGAVYPVHLSFQNPHIIDAAGEKAGNIQFGDTGKAFRDAIRSGKYDSVIIKNTADEGNIYVALKPGQIKSAIGNRGAYDPSDPRINYGIAGLMAGTGAAAAGEQQPPTAQ
jgi:hypothetical protein